MGIVLSMYVWCLPVHAEPSRVPRILSTARETFSNTECKETGTCSLIEFSIVHQKYRVYVNGLPHLGTRMFAQYETDRLSELTDYAIVQFIRGCVFESVLVEGEKKIIDSIVVRSFLDIVPFRFPEWVIDSDEKDPVYSSFQGDRYFSAKWSLAAPETVGARQYYFGLRVPPRPVLFISDRPGSAFLDGDVARNISLQFRTCLYRASAVPKKTKRTNMYFAEPIHCFGWQSSFIYNFALEQFESKLDIDLFCKESVPKISPVQDFIMIPAK